MKRKLASLLLASAMTAVLAAGCGSGEENAGSSDSSQPGTEADIQQEGQEENGENVKAEILVAAAASLEYAYEDELIPMFEEQNPNITVSGTYDSSGKLQTQIEEGMEADIFMSAATKQMDALTEEGIVEEDSVTDLLENKIVLITSADSQLKISSFEDITKADTIAVGDPASVPVGQYSEEALTNLGLWDQVLAKASFGTNVTEVLNWVAEGSAQVGIVYATDAATTDKVKVVAEAPEDSLAEPAIYPVGVVSASENKEAAEKFVEFLKSDEAIQIFEDYGFIKR